jgi:hypothetical protein
MLNERRGEELGDAIARFLACSLQKTGLKAPVFPSRELRLRPQAELPLLSGTRRIVQ